MRITSKKGSLIGITDAVRTTIIEYRRMIDRHTKWNLDVGKNYIRKEV